jgi:wobble nucleotide-excising tRNase
MVQLNHKKLLQNLVSLLYYTQVYDKIVSYSSNISLIKMNHRYYTLGLIKKVTPITNSISLNTTINPKQCIIKLAHIFLLNDLKSLIHRMRFNKGLVS